MDEDLVPGLVSAKCLAMPWLRALSETRGWVSRVGPASGAV